MPTPIHKLAVTYESQLDNSSGEGWRECFSSSCAMLAIYNGKVSNDNEYNQIRRHFGDTTDPRTQINTLKKLGLSVAYSTSGTRDALACEIFKNRPVAVGWLHKGPASNPRGGGHWSVVVGINGPKGVFMHDPYGEADLVNGGYLANTDGSYLSYSWKNWGPRWEVEGPGTGWMVTARA
jgi:hypothetical protein